ncbi:sulfotransferase [Candidatus Bipolaricaulota bacterium]
MTVTRVDPPVAFIVGSPRSGTTVLGDILDHHPALAYWYEPYFILDRFFRLSQDDLRRAEDARPEICTYIRGEFDGYRRSRKGSIVVDKSPRNSLKIPFLNRVFPESKFIHIVRDGRDATLSIHREWLRRQQALQSGSIDALRRRLVTMASFLRRQPLLRHKLAALRFEMGDMAQVLRGSGWLHRARWKGAIGWGPRFEDWYRFLHDLSLLEFNAMQWRRCVEQVLVDVNKLSSDRVLEIRYERLLDDPTNTLNRILDFLEVGRSEEMFSRMPALKRGNYGKWDEAFTREEKAKLGPILQPLLETLGYAGDVVWYK